MTGHNMPPNDGYPFQVEPRTWAATWEEPEYTEWVVIYQNYPDQNRREIVYQASTLQEALDWINNK